MLVIVACLGAIAGCTSRTAAAAESTAAECSNGSDDDRDGLIDCADRACTMYAFCATGGIDGGGADGAMPADGGPPADRMIGPSCSAPLDVVFVMDVSTSMADEAMRLREGVESIWTAANALTSDAEFRLVVFVDDAFADGGCASFADVGTLQTRLDHWRAFCAMNRSPSSSTTNTDCPENSLDAIWLAATSCPWREGATRVLIHVTDDTFVERPMMLSGDPFFGGGVAVEHTYAEVRDALIAAEIRVGAFAAPGAGEECGAGSSANVGRGFHEAYMGLPSLPESTGGRVWSIREVRAGTLDMAASIRDLLEDEYCTLF